MGDMLVKLYDLPAKPSALPPGIRVRRALGIEKRHLIEWVVQTFSQGWADECELAFGRHPLACFLAQDGQRLIGFCTYDTTARGMMGPVGVVDRYQRQGIGRQLVLTTLADMAAQGYAYAVIGWVGPEAFFTRTTGAIPIPDSSPGFYRDRLISPSDTSH